MYDGKLIRPADEPTRARVVFDRREALSEALTRRVELRRGLLKTERQELELVAAENFRKPRLDLVGRYRVHGFGDDLFGKASVPNGSAYGDLFRGDLQDWYLGIEFDTPIGNRIGRVAVRNAELNLMREQAILREEEHRIAYEVESTFSELDRAYAVTRMNYNRRITAQKRAEAVLAKYQIGNANLEFVEDAQRRAVDAESEFARSLVDYNVALASVHLSRGSYLEYVGVFLTESPETQRTYEVAAKPAPRFRTIRPAEYLEAPAPAPPSATAPPQLLQGVTYEAPASLPMLRRLPPVN